MSIICFDANAATNDDVQKATRATAAMLEKRGAVVRIARVPVEDGVNGPDDFIGQHGAVAFWKLIDAAVPCTTTKNAGTQDEATKDSQATILVRLAREAGAEFFHDDDTSYFGVCVGDHRETHKLRSRSGKAWLVSLFVDKFDKSPGSQAMADAANTLEALALRGSEERVYVRIAAVDGRIYIDLVDATWRCIEINRTSWRIISNPPVRFRRPKGLLPLPVPQPGGSVSDLRKFVNVTTDNDFVLLVSLLVAWLRGRGPYPVLVENGEQGSAKSTLTRILNATSRGRFLIQHFAEVVSGRTSSR